MFLSFVPIGLWITALFSGVKVSIMTLVGMRFRRVQPIKIVNPMIKATKAGLSLSIDKLEAHYLAGGDVNSVVNALIAAQRANINLEFEQAAAIDLAGRDVLEAVQVSVNPKVIETPIISAVAKDGIEVKVKARVTVRANIERLVGGAGEETIIARVGEGVVTTVGSSTNHKEVLENPDKISKTVLDKGLDSGTAFDGRTSGQVLFTLPVGWRPSHNIHMALVPGVGQTQTVPVVIKANGEAIFIGSGTLTQPKYGSITYFVAE